MKLVFHGNHILRVIKEKGDRKYRRSEWADAESTFLYDVKKELEKRGLDCIKKRMWKDGHMVDDSVQYIRDRSGDWCIWNSSYAIYDAGEQFNEFGEVALDIEDSCHKVQIHFKKKEDNK